MSKLEHKCIEMLEPPELEHIKKADRDVCMRVLLTMMSLHESQDEYICDKEYKIGWTIVPLADSYCIQVTLKPGVKVSYYDLSTIVSVDYQRVRDVWSELVVSEEDTNASTSAGKHTLCCEVSTTDEEKSISHVTIVQRRKMRRVV